MKKSINCCETIPIGIWIGTQNQNAFENIFFGFEIFNFEKIMSYPNALSSYCADSKIIVQSRVDDHIVEEVQIYKSSKHCYLQKAERRQAKANDTCFDSFVFFGKKEQC